ncbi:hypothetical protein B7H01_15220 [Pandoraea apista]|nr:hypothetical protein B7H01_15220 [Pandoraea apista]RRW92367.1 FadR family transcriptional regulator [Pandoraea apista]RRX01833.1 FadR family transcriptional regulator [Pandoraea apista]
MQPDTLVAAKRKVMVDLVESLRTRLANGEALPAERQLADELGVKRHQLRNALKVLRDEGELESPRGRGEGQSRRNGEILAGHTNVLEVIELRLALEPFLARLAAVRATPVEISRIERAATTSPGADRGSTDLAFHRAVAAASGNALAADIYQIIRRVGSDIRLHVQQPVPHCPERIRQRDREHQAIAEAIRNRAPDLAETAMREHLIRVREQIMARMVPGSQNN